MHSLTQTVLSLFYLLSCIWSFCMCFSNKLPKMLTTKRISGVILRIYTFIELTTVWNTNSLLAIVILLADVSGSACRPLMNKLQQHRKTCSMLEIRFRNNNLELLSRHLDYDQNFDQKCLLYHCIASNTFNHWAITCTYWTYSLRSKCY